MKAYSQDLRERAASGCAEPGAKIHQVAVRFAVSLSFTNKLLPRQRTSGRGAALPLHPGPAPLLDAAGDQRLRACLAAPPDATLAEISLALLAAGGPLPSRPAVWRATERLGWGRKKKCPRRRARPGAGGRAATIVWRNRSQSGLYPLCLRGRNAP